MKGDNQIYKSYTRRRLSTSKLGAKNPHKQDVQETEQSPNKTSSSILGLWGVRYQVKDVKRSIEFYTQTLGFNLDMQNLPAFGQVSFGNLKLILSDPGASASRPMPDGRQQEPGSCISVMRAERQKLNISTS